MPLVVAPQHDSFARRASNDIETELRALPTEALQATLEQQITQLDRLQQSNEEMTRLVRVAQGSAVSEHVKTSIDASGDEDVVLDEDSVHELSQACTENVDVIRRKQDLIKVMHRILEEQGANQAGGATAHTLSDDLQRRVTRALSYDGRAISDDASQEDVGMHL